jgi:hypothetical protein
MNFCNYLFSVLALLLCGGSFLVNPKRSERDSLLPRTLEFVFVSPQRLTTPPASKKKGLDDNL